MHTKLLTARPLMLADNSDAVADQVADDRREYSRLFSAPPI